MYDVAIIGAGVIGAMTARLLAHYKLSLCVLEKNSDVAMGTTKANSAIVHAGFDAKAGSLKAKTNVHGSKLMAEICRDLQVSYRQNGSLVLGFTPEDKEALLTLLENGIQNRVSGLSLLEKEELCAIEPNVGKGATCALYAPTGAIVCPYELTIAAMGNAMDNGAELKLDFQVSSILQTEKGYKITASSGESLEARHVINAAGLYADSIAAMVGDASFTIHPRKGEYLLLDKEAGNIVTHTIFTVPTKAGKGILVSPTVDNNLLLGPTAQDGTDKEDFTTSKEGLDSVKAAATKSAENIDFRLVITSFCGLRAAGSTGDFIINSPKPGFYNAAGIESPGLSASPAIAEMLAQLLQNGGLSLQKKETYIQTRKSYKHFCRLPEDEKNDIIRENPAFGNIVCRCEEITEGEILHALKSNPKPRDLDGVKRRTRAQMGRCQGGFCSPYILELIAKELGIPLEAVTKNGGASTVLTGKTKEDTPHASC